MAERAKGLTWSAQFAVAPSSASKRLPGDKINLPQSALEGLLAAAPVVSLENGHNSNVTSDFDPYNPHSYAAEQHMRQQFADRQQQLPHPLTFRLVNPSNGRIVYAGIREFSAEEGTVGLSHFLREALGIEEDVTRHSSVTPPSENGDVAMENTSNGDTGLHITIHAKELAKGSYVRLRPLEAGYDPEDWKSLLERYMRDNFTTLTNGEILDVPGGGKERFRFLVDKFEPEGEGICVVDTDLEVDIEALNEEQARETLRRRIEKTQRAPGTKEGSSSGGKLKVGQDYTGQVIPGEYVDFEVRDWGKDGLAFELEATDEADLDVFVSPFSARQRSKPREDEHTLGDFDSRPTKRLRLGPSNVELEGAEAMLVSVRGWRPDESNDEQLSDAPRSFILRTMTGIEETSHAAGYTDLLTSTDEVKCKNCQQMIPKRTMSLHEAFCYRNNILCPKCHQVFQKRSPEWSSHWHCQHDSAHGNTPLSRVKHDSIYHPTEPLTCSACSDFVATSLPLLAQHRTTTCPAKPILCQFCHLVVPQQDSSNGDLDLNDPEVLLSGLTPHELADGGRTTECHICNRIVRLRDMKTHMKHHDLDRLQRPRPHLCSNAICGRTIAERDYDTARVTQLGLCNTCFGPLYAAAYDPEGKALRRRVERRLLQQLMAGCGKSYCTNEAFCRTAKKNQAGNDKAMSAKDALVIVKPVMDVLSGKTTAQDSSTGTMLAFCTDEPSQKRRLIAEMLTSEGSYDIEWCVKGLEEGHGDIGKARDWLRDWAPKVEEKRS